MEWLEEIIERDGKVDHVTRSDDGKLKVYKDVKVVRAKFSCGDDASPPLWVDPAPPHRSE